MSSRIFFVLSSFVLLCVGCGASTPSTPSVDTEEHTVGEQSESGAAEQSPEKKTITGGEVLAILLRDFPSIVCSTPEKVVVACYDTTPQECESGLKNGLVECKSVLPKEMETDKVKPFMEAIAKCAVAHHKAKHLQRRRDNKQCSIPKQALINQWVPQVCGDPKSNFRECYGASKEVCEEIATKSFMTCPPHEPIPIESDEGIGEDLAICAIHKYVQTLDPQGQKCPQIIEAIETEFPDAAKRYRDGQTP